MQNKIEYWLFISFSKLFCFLGIDISRKVSKLLAVIFFYCIPIRKNVVIKNVKLAFPEFSEDEIQSLAFRIYASAAITIVEILAAPSVPHERMKKLVHTNYDYVLKRYKEGKGIIMMSAHFGNWEFAGPGLGLQLGVPISGVSKNQRNPYVNDWIINLRKSWGNPSVPLGVSIRQIYVEIKKKNIVGLVADQRGPKEAPRVQFFGIPSAVYTGPAALSLKTGAPLLMGLMVRQKDFTYEFHVEEISKAGLPEDEEAAILEMSQRHTAFLEAAIRKNPDQWFWMHNRWKY